MSGKSRHFYGTNRADPMKNGKLFNLEESQKALMRSIPRVFETAEVDCFFSPEASFFEKITAPACQVKQVHGRAVLDVRSEHVNDLSGSNFSRFEFDGMLTSRPNLVLTIYSADCLPLLFFDPEKKVVGAVHAGWRGSFLNISRDMVKKIAEVYQGDPAHLRVVCGPSIHVCCFEIQNDVAEKFHEKFPQWPDLIRREKGRQTLDLQALNRRQLMEEGVLENNIETSDVCTFCSARRLPSYRRDGARAGRIISGIRLK
ncbi:MAG: peptidoglycan editing factor PgeF [Nitrospirae bacterium]|nr:peptidoglycan editing factor PgeF [Nitrospirota bacterium]